jgi:5-methylcytosine-specific restriction protein A
MAEQLWTDDELRAALIAYLRILELEANRTPYSPTRLHRELIAGELSGRTLGSVGRRMSNITATLAEAGRPHSVRYKPLSQVGTHVRQRLLALHDELLQGGATADPLVFRARVGALTKGKLSKPRGSRKPGTETASVLRYVRDPKVAAWTLEQAKGICDCCSSPAPFARADGTPFLEVHHVRTLASGGADTPDNTVAVCPNVLSV